jgi:hypothetical protein
MTWTTCHTISFSRAWTNRKLRISKAWQWHGSFATSSNYPVASKTIFREINVHLRKCTSERTNFIRLKKMFTSLGGNDSWQSWFLHPDLGIYNAPWKFLQNVTIQIVLRNRTSQLQNVVIHNTPNNKRPSIKTSTAIKHIRYNKTSQLYNIPVTKHPKLQNVQSKIHPKLKTVPKGNGDAVQQIWILIMFTKLLQLISCLLFWA